MSTIDFDKRKDHELYINCNNCKRKTYHSFRHTVADHLKQKGVAKEKISAILGHKDESITTGWYGKPYEPAILVPVIEMLQFSVDIPTFKNTT